MTHTEGREALLPCPWCGETLTIRRGRNPYGRCDTDGCWMNARALVVVLQDPAQVAAWNTRTHAESGALEILARVRSIVDAACDRARSDEQIANRESRESGDSDGVIFHHGRHMAVGCISEALEELEAEFGAALATP